MTTDRQPRPWRCKFRRCGREAVSDETMAIPAGWIGVRQYPGNRDDRVRNIGVFCTVGCVVAGLEEMARDGVL